METGHAAPNQYKYDSAPLYSAAVPQKELSQKTKQQSPQSFRFSFRSAFYIPFYTLLAAQRQILQLHITIPNTAKEYIHTLPL
jgi:hypothetical protein